MQTAQRMIAGFGALIALAISAQTPAASRPNATPANGLLRVHPTNPRYFTDGTKNSDGSLRAVYHFSLYDAPFEQPQQESAAWQSARQNLKLTRILATRVQDLARLVPRPDLAGTGYCLANEGKEYIVYAPRQEEFAVSGLLTNRAYRFEWIDTARGNAKDADMITAEGTTHRFRPPGKDAVLFLVIHNTVPDREVPGAAPSRRKSTPNH